MVQPTGGAYASAVFRTSTKPSRLVRTEDCFCDQYQSVPACFAVGTPSKTVMKTSKRVYDAEAPPQVTVRQAEPIAVTNKPPLGGYTTGGAPQTVAAPEGASLGAVAPVPVNTSKFGRFRKTGKPVLSTVVPEVPVVLPTGQHTTVTDPNNAFAPNAAIVPNYAPNYGGIGAPVQTSEVEMASDGVNGNLGRGAWASKGASGDGSTVV